MPQDGLIGNLTYRYLDMVAGRKPSIDRFDASLAYRWWAGDVGFDIELTYADGIEPNLSQTSIGSVSRLA